MPPSEPSRDVAEYVQFTSEQLQLATGTPVGAGAISQVLSSTLSSSGLPIVVKVLSKIQLLQQRKVESAMNEKAALLRLGPHPYIVRMYGTAQSEDELYFVLESLPHGDLLQHIRRSASRRLAEFTAATRPNVARQRESAAADTGACAAAVVAAPLDDLSSDPGVDKAPAEAAASEVVPIPVSSSALRCLDYNDIRLITAQLVLALARAHETGIVLRDLKPENIVFDSKYRACLVDFDTVDLSGRAARPETNYGVALRPTGSASGSAAGSGPTSAARRISVSEIQSMRRKTASFCGTAQYVSPEMVGECKWSFSSDLWALGATVYEMLYGIHMFSGLSAFEVLSKVVKGVGNGAVPFPFVALGGPGGEDAFHTVKDFICRLTNLDPLCRLGVDPVSGAFDLAAVKAHAFFRDFEWDVVESHLFSFRPRRFPRVGEAAEATVVVADPDPSPSLREHYHLVPFNDPSYAEYVYRATADANPFERFMRHIILKEEENATLASGGGAAAATSKTTAAGAKEQRTSSDSSPVDSPPSSAGPARFLSSNDDDEMDVIDDVGMSYAGMGAHEDFRR